MLELLNIEMPKKGFKTEASFTTGWLKGLKAKGYFVHKISDASRNLKPFDCMICTDKHFYGCEIKIIDNDKFSIDNLRPNQQAALEKITNLGGEQNAIVCVYSKKFNNYTVMPYKNLIKEIK